MSFLKITNKFKGKLRILYPLFKLTLNMLLIILSVIIILMIVSNLYSKRLSLNNNKELLKLQDELNTSEYNDNINSLITKYDLFLREAYFSENIFRKYSVKLIIFLFFLLLINLKILYEFKRDKTELYNKNRTGSSNEYISEIIIILILFTIFILTSVKVQVTLPEKLNNKKVNKEDLSKNWPTFRGYRNIGIASHTKVQQIESIKKEWEIPLELNGFNSPVIWKDQVFLSAADKDERKIYSFNINSGKLNWSQNTTHKNIAVPDVTEDTGLAASTMATDGKYAAALFATGELICTDLNGKIIWEKKLPTPVNHYGHSASLISMDNLLYVQFDHSESAALYAFNFSNGDIVWKKERDVDISWTSPSIIPYSNDNDQLLLIATPHIISYEPLTGKELWRATDLISGELAPSAAYIDKKIFVANQYSELAALNYLTGEVLWLFDDNLPDVSSPVASGKYLVLPSSYGAISLLDTTTKHIYFSEELSDGFYSSPIIKDGYVFIIDKKGDLFIFEIAEKFNLLKKIPLNDGVVSTPAFAGDLMIIRSLKKLICLSIIYE